MENVQNNNPNSLDGFKKFFLQSSAGKLFFTLFIAPFIAQIVTIGIGFLNSDPSFIDPSFIFLLFPIVMITFMALFLSWFYILGTSLFSKLPSGNNMNIKFFKFNLIFAFVYMLIFVANIAFGQIVNFGLLFLFHLYTTYCMFYGLYFISKSLTSIEIQREAKFSDYLGTFFMIWFFPIGIWAVQPKINKIFG